ncbi:MAG: cytochrome c [Planctomycetes bacterium]|nr:cytochrome c [Planctomycetota bacterium]
MFPCSVLAKTGLHGLVRSGQYAKGELRSMPQPETIKQSVDGVYRVGTYPLYTPELVPGKGREITQGYCNMCHSVTYITMQPPLPATTWAAEVFKMIDTYGALIPDDETKQIVAYLQSHYTTETRKNTKLDMKGRQDIAEGEAP